MAHTKEMAKQNATELKAVFDNYFLLKDALVKTDAELHHQMLRNLPKR
ncbi:hypothetical protein LWM68_45300 [Niabella sp. W65]|nr:hypothetical protein [Niabella sp. W65]MCH7369319.1 hypothetical protein [Niabella sp. W65]